MAPNARNDATIPPRTGPNTRRVGGSVATPEESQDIKDSLEGRKFLEKHSLLCPTGEPASNGTIASADGRTSKTFRHSPSWQVTWHGNLANAGKSGECKNPELS